MDLTSGVVLDVGYGIVTCAAMWKGEEFPKTVSCDPDEATPIKLADMVHRVVSKASKDAEMESTLIEHIVVTGIIYHTHKYAVYTGNGLQWSLIYRASTFTGLLQLGPPYVYSTLLNFR